jgi:hypothetical protein
MRIVLTVLGILALTATVPGQGATGSRTVLLILDDVQTESGSTSPLRQVAGRLVRGLTQAGVQCALATTSTETLVVPPTADEGALLTAIGRVTGEGLKPADILAARQQQPENEVRRRAALAASRAAGAVASFAAAQKGEAFDVVFVSPGYERPPGVPADAIGEAALRAGVPVHVVDVRALGGDGGPRSSEWRTYANASRAALVGLAAQTRGETVLSRPELDALTARFRPRK